MLEPARTRNSTFPARFLRTPNQSLAKHNRKPSQIIENNQQRPKSIASFCRVFCDYKGNGAQLKLAATESTANAKSRRDAGATKVKDAQARLPMLPGAQLANSTCAAGRSCRQ
jgi:hypothetical protein